MRGESWDERTKRELGAAVQSPDARRGRTATGGLPGYAKNSILAGVRACRAVYTVKFKGAVFALHAFQKKSRKGTVTARQDLERVRLRLRSAERIHAEMFAGTGGLGEEEG